MEKTEILSLIVFIITVILCLYLGGMLAVKWIQSKRRTGRFLFLLVKGVSFCVLVLSIDITICLLLALLDICGIGFPYWNKLSDTIAGDVYSGLFLKFFFQPFIELLSILVLTVYQKVPVAMESS